MALTAINATGSIRYPGVARVGIGGAAGDTFDLWRQDDTGPRHRVRGALNLTVPASGILQVYDTEAPLNGEVVYIAQTTTTALTSSVMRMNGPGNRAVIRSVLDPLVRWRLVEIQDETDLERASRTTVFPIIGRADPVAVGDVRRSESGTLVFLARSLVDANAIIDVFQEGEPIVLRTSCTSLIRDKIITGLGYREVRYGKSGARLCLVDFQEIGWPDTHPLIPEVPPGSWTYGDMRDSARTKYPTYADIATPDPAENYFALATGPF